MFKERIKQRFKVSKMRSQILENMQGLQDYVTKMIKRKEQHIAQRIVQLERELSELKSPKKKKKFLNCLSFLQD